MMTPNAIGRPTVVNAESMTGLLREREPTAIGRSSRTWIARRGYRASCAGDGCGRRAELMGRLRRPLVPDGPVAVFYERLHALHLAAGEPSMRQLQRRTRSDHQPGGINPTTVHDVFV